MHDAKNLQRKNRAPISCCGRNTKRTLEVVIIQFGFSIAMRAMKQNWNFIP